MSTYKQFENYVRKTWRVLEDRDAKPPKGYMGLLFETSDDRSQILLIHPSEDLGGGEVAIVLSRIGELSGNKLKKALEFCSECFIGGLVSIDGFIYLRHSILLANVDENEIEIPILAVSAVADVLEEKLLGSDAS